MHNIFSNTTWVHVVVLVTFFNKIIKAFIEIHTIIRIQGIVVYELFTFDAGAF